MKPATIKTFLSVHSWTGIGAGMALFIAFYAGAMTVFYHELEVWDAYRSEVPVAQSHADAQTLLDEVLAVDPDAAPNMRLYPSQPGHPENVVRWFERLEDGTFETHEYRRAAGEPLNDEVDNSHLAGFIYRLHYTAGLPSSFGLYVLGIICLIYGMALVSGIVLFVPNFLKDLFVIRPGRNKKRFWLDTHNVVGVVSLPWHIMFAWSSAVLAIGVFFLAPFQYLVFEEDLIELLGPELGAVAPLEPSGESAPMLSVAEIMAIAEDEAPGIAPTQLRYANAGDANGMVTVFGTFEAGTLVPSGSVVMRLASGEVLNVSHPEEASAAATFYNGLISLHFASFGGFTLKWVYFVLGLTGAYLFYSGNLLWIETRRRRRQPEQPATGLLVARLNSGVCIGCMAGVSAAFLASRAFAEFDNRGDLTELAYFGVFFAAVAWAFLRPVALGTRDLLYAAALFTAAIPVFVAIFTDMPIWRSALLGHWPFVAVDVLALLGACAFWRMARGVERRAKSGDPNSVWAHGVDNAGFSFAPQNS